MLPTPRAGLRAHRPRKRAIGPPPNEFRFAPSGNRERNSRLVPQRCQVKRNVSSHPLSNRARVKVHARADAE